MNCGGALASMANSHEQREAETRTELWSGRCLVCVDRAGTLPPARAGAPPGFTHVAPRPPATARAGRRGPDSHTFSGGVGADRRAGRAVLPADRQRVDPVDGHRFAEGDLVQRLVEAQAGEAVQQRRVGDLELHPREVLAQGSRSRATWSACPDRTPPDLSTLSATTRTGPGDTVPRSCLRQGAGQPGPEVSGPPRGPRRGQRSSR